MRHSSCALGDNGNGRCRRSDSIDEIIRAIEGETQEREAGQGQILEAIGILTGEVSDLIKRVGDAPNPNVGYEGTGLQRTIYRLAIRPAQMSIDYDENGDTESLERSALVVRLRTSEREASSLRAEVAALQATQVERDRQSGIVRDDRRERRRMVGAIVVAVLSSGALTWLATWLAGG